MICIENGRYEFGVFKLAISLVVKPDCITAVLGPSGAGKSTLLNIISGFEDLTSGQVLIDGEIVNAQLPAQRPVSFIFQDNNCFAHLSARDNVALGIAPDLKLNEAQWVQVDAALLRVGLAQLSQRLPGDMSGGERQRIALARVLVRNKPVLLLDEAFAALGPALRRDMIGLVMDLQKELRLTVLMVTHQPEDAKLAALEIIFVDEGVARTPINTAAFFATRDDGRISRYLGEVY